MMKENTELYRQPKPLVQRINSQRKFGTRDLTQWFLALASPHPSDRVLDIGCGSGNHLLAFAAVCAGGVGIDFSQDLLRSSQEAAVSLGIAPRLRLIQASGDNFDLGSDKFEIVMCNFAIYYMNVPQVLDRIARHLVPQGTAYVMGSPDENAQELLKIHGQATDYIPSVYAPGYSDIRKYETMMKRFFNRCQFERFFNPLRFPTVNDFMDYYRSTALYQMSSKAQPHLEDKVVRAAREVWQTKGMIQITKVVDTAVLKEPVAEPP